MDTATRSPLTEQAEKLANLARHLSDGRLLEPVLRKSQTGDVWSGPVHDGFLAWLQFAVDGWVRNQLAQGLRLVAESLTNRAAEFERASQAMMATGQNIVVPPPAPLNYSPGRPPPYGDIGGGSNSRFNPDGMTALANLLESTADGAVIDFARSLRTALEPPPAPPPPPGAPPAISPLPPDAAAAVGDPGNSSPGTNAYLALANELHIAAEDIGKRVRNLRLFDEPLPTATLDPNLISNVGAGAAAGVQSATDAVSGTQDPQTPTATLTPTRTPEEIEKARQDGAAAAGEVAKIASYKNFDEKDHEKLFIALNKAEKHAEDPDYAIAFIESLVPDGLTSWCKLMSRGSINVLQEMDILRPISRLLGTATQQGDAFSPEARGAILGSGCLDTLVHYGDFDHQFALDAARKILKDPGKYERSDGSKRVYSGLNREGDYEKGDARVGALRLLANNPEAAKEILETYGPEGRRLVLDALEDGGLAGKEAAAALEAGLHDLNSKISEDTLELVIRNSASNELKLCDFGKQAMARILSSEEGMKRLQEIAIADTRAAQFEWKTSEDGFNVPFDTFQKCIGKVLADKVAHAEFLGRIATYSAAELRGTVAALGQTQIVEPYENQPQLKSAVENLGRLFQGVAKGVEDASGEKERNAFLAAGLDMLVSQSVALVPGGYAGKFILDKALETAGGESVDKILDKKNQERIRNLDKDGLKDELNRNGRNLVIVSVLSDKGVTDQLLHPQSPLRRWDKDGDGVIEVPEPHGKDWKAFMGDVAAEKEGGTPIGRVLLELSDWTETFKI